MARRASPPSHPARHSLIVLGIHAGHDAAAAIVEDGIIVADAQEERFRRIKHVHGFPSRAVEACLAVTGHDLEAVDVVAVAGGQPSRITDTFLGLASARSRLRSLAEHAPMGSLRPAPMEPPRTSRRFPLRPDCEVDHVDHHRAHAASAEFTNSWTEPSLLVTADGIGDGTSLTITHVSGGSRRELMSVGPEGSLGWFYGIVTEGLGWIHGDGEGKTMGLAPYGDARPGHARLRTLCPRYEGGRLVEERSWRGPRSWSDAGVYLWHFPEADDVAELAERIGREAVAASAQRLLEEELFGLVTHWLGATGTRRIACAGGVFLNVKLNQRIWQSGLVDHQHIYPNCGDAGLAAGAALDAYGRRHPGWPGHDLTDVYTGPDADSESCLRALELSGFAFQRLDDPAAEAADLLAAGDIVAWVQGRMESGPRALGNRSFLISPARPDAKDVMNAKVKFREGFRPFCPSLPLSEFDTYLDGARDEPFMVTSFDASADRASSIPSVVHVDGTVRPQAVTPGRNRRYAALLDALGERTGVPVVLNTSLNIRGEPIVNTAFDALRCFGGSGCDHLVLDEFIVSKQR